MNIELGGWQCIATSIYCPWMYLLNLLSVMLYNICVWMYECGYQMWVFTQIPPSRKPLRSVSGTVVAPCTPIPPWTTLLRSTSSPSPAMSRVMCTPSACSATQPITRGSLSMRTTPICSPKTEHWTGMQIYSWYLSDWYGTVTDGVVWMEPVHWYIGIELLQFVNGTQWDWYSGNYWDSTSSVWLMYGC